MSHPTRKNRRAPSRRSPNNKKLADLGKKISGSLPKPRTDSETTELRQLAGQHPFVLFGVYQIAAILDIHHDIVSAVARHPNTVFLHSAKKARPEWVLEFLRNPPKDFVAKR